MLSPAKDDSRPPKSGMKNSDKDAVDQKYSQARNAVIGKKPSSDNSGENQTKMTRAEDAMAFLQGLTGDELVRFTDLSMVRDEKNNPVTVKKADEFMEKRPGLNLRGLRLSEWPNAIQKNKKADAPAAA